MTVPEAADAAHQLVAAKPIADAVYEMEPDAVKARFFEGLGDQAAVVLMDARHQLGQIDGAVAVGEVENRVHVLACKEMSRLDVDAPEAEKAIVSKHLDDFRIGDADVGAGLLSLVANGLFEAKRHVSPRSRVPRSRDDIQTLFRYLS